MNYSLMPLIISLKTTLAATLITFILGVAAAYGMAYKKGRLKAVLDGIFIFPLVLPPTVVGFLLLVLFGRKGPLGGVFQSMGINIVFSWSATVIAAVVVSFPLMYKTSKSAFEQIDFDLINVAKTLGVSNFEIFLKISIPLAWPGVTAGCILAFARALGEFGATIMLAGNIPGRTQTIPLAIYFAVEGGDNKAAYFWVLIIIMISMLSVLIMNFWLLHQQKFIKGK